MPQRLEALANGWRLLGGMFFGRGCVCSRGQAVAAGEAQNGLAGQFAQQGLLEVHTAEAARHEFSGRLESLGVHALESLAFYLLFLHAMDIGLDDAPYLADGEMAFEELGAARQQQPPLR